LFRGIDDFLDLLIGEAMFRDQLIANVSKLFALSQTIPRLLNAMLSEFLTRKRDRFTTGDALAECIIKTHIAAFALDEH
jgi:hypothetical protein